MPVNLPVIVRFANGHTAHGRLVQLSISGALLATAAIPPTLAPLQIQVGGRWLGGYAVRQQPGYLAIEWADLSAEQFVAMQELSTQTHQSHCASPGAA